MPLVLILSQMHPVHTFPTLFPKDPFQYYFSSIHTSSKWSLTFSFSTQNNVGFSHSPHTCYMPCPSHPPWFDCPNNILWSIQENTAALLFNPNTFTLHKTIISHFEQCTLRIITKKEQEKEYNCDTTRRHSPEDLDVNTGT